MDRHGEECLDRRQPRVAGRKPEDLADIELDSEDQPDRAKPQAEERRQASNRPFVQKADQPVAQRDADQDELGPCKEDEACARGQAQAGEGLAVAHQGDGQEKRDSDRDLQHAIGLPRPDVTPRRLTRSSPDSPASPP